MAPVDGFWGPPTSTLDWCEANYAVSGYIAEFWNTISNLSMILPPVYGIYEVLRQKFETRFAVNFALLLAVGLGSWAFHMTLWYEMQLTDELPMVFCSCFHIYCLAEIHQIKSGGHLNWLSVGLTIYSFLFSLSYIWFPDPLFHQVNYGLATVAITLLDINVLRTQKDGQVWRLFFTGIVLYGVAFTLWNVDNHLCHSIRWLRTRLPAFLAPLTELHAWWHLFAGYASYMNILFCLKTRNNVRNEKSAMTVGPMGLTIRRTEVPEQICVQNGYVKDQNGHAKGQNGHTNGFINNNGLSNNHRHQE